MAKINVGQRVVPATSERAPAASSTPRTRELMEPKSEHLMKICDSSVKDFDTTGKKANGGQGQMITFVFEVIEGEFTGRKVWQNVCVKHTGSLQAEEIGREFMDTLCRSLHIVSWPDDTEEFHNKPLIGVVGKHDSYNGEDRNQIAYTKAYGAAPKKAAAKKEAKPQTGDPDATEGGEAADTGDEWG